MPLDDICTVTIERTGLTDSNGGALPDEIAYSQEHWCEVRDGAAGVNIVVGGSILEQGATRRFVVRWFEHDLLPPSVVVGERGRVTITHRGLEWGLLGITELGRRKYLEIEADRQI